ERMLRTLDEVTSIESPFEIHVGAAHGSVFAGDLGARTRRVYTVMGDTVNLAARLASAAEPGQILVTEEFDDVHIFETTALEAISLKGKSKPVIPYLLGGPIEAADGGVESDLLPLIGRAAELETLTNLVKEAADGSGSIVTVVGAAGLGKTRLLQEVRTEAADTRVIVANCEPYESNTAYFAIGQLVRNALGVHREDEDPPGKLTEILVNADPELAPWVPLVARVAGISMDPTPEVAALDAKFQETKTAEVIGDAMAATLDGTVIAFIDGAQWIDDASQSLLDHMVPTISAQPWVVVESSRVAPEDEDAQTLTLDPLGDEATTALAVAALGDE
ncbi:MAG: AAA family ATPase, partial [Acidimicrobiia bacterium]|nr:AAA family ATPase [Acidimicrobiia bacterium]